MVEVAGNDKQGHVRTAGWSGPVFKDEVVFGSLPPDLHGKVIKVVTEAAVKGGVIALVLEGPRGVAWSTAAGYVSEHGWTVHINDFLTTEFGEAAARRRVCLVAASGGFEGNPMDRTTSSSSLAAPMSAQLEPARMAPAGHWGAPVRMA